MSLTSKNRLLPAYPLFVKDPFFSFWSPCDELNGANVIFWTGMERKFYGAVHADGVSYTFLGAHPRGVKLKQKSVTLSAYTTDYAFECDKFDLTVSFISPLPLDNLDVLSCPVCFMTYKITPKVHISELSIALFIGESICRDKNVAPVHGGVYALPQGKTAWIGLKKQMLLSQSTDSSAAEWGYWFLTGKSAGWYDGEAVNDYMDLGQFVASNKGDDKYIGVRDSYTDVSSAVSGKFSLAFDDIASINYFGDIKKGYYFDGGKTVIDAISEAWSSFDTVMSALEKMDSDLAARCEPYGDDYLLIVYASLRQAIAAHKLIKNKNGEPLFLSKECHSNGCIGTVDVSYPSIPLFLLYNPELVKGMLRPIFDFAAMPVWKYDFAPHDVGTYPQCLGQVYGYHWFGAETDGEQYIVNGGNRAISGEPSTPYCYPQLYYSPMTSDGLYKYEDQMPVEESGNMLIMVAAALAADNDVKFVKKNYSALKKWVKYLVKYGLVPGDQLCTDDFSGHLDKNVNLSVKSIVGIRAYAYICERLGKADEASRYLDIAADYAKKWKQTAGSPSTLAFDSEGTFSLKYNMLFDVLFGTNLFADVMGAEIDNYLSKSNAFGVPLDSRATITKSDWIAWCAACSGDMAKRKALLAPIAEYLRRGKNRVAFGDWYDTVSGNQIYFTNRTVQGGMFAPLLADSKKLLFKK